MCAIAPSTPSTTFAAITRRGTPCTSRPRSAGRTRGSTRPHGRVAAHLAARVEQRAHERRQVRRDAGRVDQQRLGGAADAGAAQLGVQHDRARHVEVGGAIHVDVADALEVADHRHARLLLHARDEALAAARHDHVDVVGHAGEHVADGRAVLVGTSWMQASGRPAARSPSTRQAWIACSSDGSRCRRAGSPRCPT
jgi:hypothetical protein